MIFTMQYQLRHNTPSFNNHNRHFVRQAPYGVKPPIKKQLYCSQRPESPWSF